MNSLHKGTCQHLDAKKENATAIHTRKQLKFQPSSVPYFDDLIGGTAQGHQKEPQQMDSARMDGPSPHFIKGCIDIMPLKDRGSEIHINEKGHSLDMLLLDDEGLVSPNSREDPGPRISQIMASLESIPKPRRTRRVSFADCPFDVPDNKGIKLPDIEKKKKKQFQVVRVSENRPNEKTSKIPAIANPQMTPCNMKNKAEDLQQCGKSKGSDKLNTKYIHVFKPTKKTVNPANPLALMVNPVPKYSREKISKHLPMIQQELSLLWQSRPANLSVAQAAAENLNNGQVERKSSSNIFLTPLRISLSTGGVHGKSDVTCSSHPGKLPAIDARREAIVKGMPKGPDTVGFNRDPCAYPELPIEHQERRDAVVKGMSKAPDSVGFSHDPSYPEPASGHWDRRDAVVEGMPKAPDSVGFSQDPSAYPYLMRQYYERRNAIVQGMPDAPGYLGFSHDPYAAPLTLDKIGYYHQMKPHGANLVRPLKPLASSQGPTFSISKNTKYQKLEPIGHQ